MDMGNCNEEDKELHVVMVPYPVQGHISAMMQFAKVLINTHNVRVTFINNKHNHDCIQDARSRLSTYSYASSPLSDIMEMTSRLPHHNKKLQFLWVDNGLSPDFDYTDIVPRFKEFNVAISNMRNPVKHLLSSLNQQSPPVSCVLFGSFLPWAHSVAAELGIPSIFFWTQSTCVFSIFYHTPLLTMHGFFPYNKNALSGCTEDHVKPCKTSDVVSYIPGVQPLPPSSFPSQFRIDDISDPSFASIKDQFGMTLGNCKSVIINSFKELEKDACQAIKRELPIPVYLVGPLIPSAFLDGSDMCDTSVGASLLQEDNACIKWLDRQKWQSVLYVAFGSIFNPSAEDLEGIAHGIQASKQPFLWVIKPTSLLQNVCDMLPKGYIENTKDYGLIIPWAPQIQVLAHPSVGAFLTHCGWNSTLESLSMGIPMITLPAFSDQPTNCTYVCDFWKVGMAIKRQGDGKVMSEDVTQVVRKVMHEEEGKEMRKRAGELRELARQAVLNRGSSNIDIENFIRSIIMSSCPPPNI